MISIDIRRAILWINLTLNVATYVKSKSYKESEEFFQVKQGIRSQRAVFKSAKTKTPFDCVLLCFEEKTCKSFDYAEPSSANDDENCELHNDDGDSLLFLKDERYTFYQIPEVAHKSENTQMIQSVTKQEIKPQLNGSCVDYFNSGWRASGDYIILDWQKKPRTVHCDMESEPGSVWTLIMSFTRENKDLKQFRYMAMYEDAPANEYKPNWSNYRISLNQMTALRKRATHWRATCSFPKHGVDINTDYARAVFADFDLMDTFYGECKKVNRISVNGQSCSECTAKWWQSTTLYTPHISHSCHITVANGHTYFGAYYSYDTTFRCTATADSTTNYWFGSYV